MDFIKKIHETGVTAVIINSNQLAKENESDEVLKKNLEYILHKTGEIKLGIYECPEPYKRLITPDVLKWMAQTNRFGFLKETSCDIKTIREKTAAVKGTSLEIYNANIPTALDSVHAGCAGVATIASNFYPELVYYLLNNMDKNNEKVEHVNEMLTVLDPLIHQIYPMSSKYFLQLRGLKISTFTRKKLKFSSQDYIKFNKLLDFLNRLSKELKIEIKKK